MDSAQLRAAAVTLVRGSRGPAPGRPPVASSRAPGHPLLAPCHSPARLPQDPGVARVHRTRTSLPAPGGGAGDPGRPFLHRPPQPCRGGHRVPRAAGQPATCPGPLKASLSSGSGTVFHGPTGFRDCHPKAGLLPGSSGLCLQEKRWERLPRLLPRLRLEGG